MTLGSGAGAAFGGILGVPKKSVLPMDESIDNIISEELSDEER